MQDLVCFFRPLDQILRPGQTVFCNKIVKPEWMEMNSVCYKEHFLMKDASHLAIVAWTENKRKPDLSILDSFEVQKIEEKGKGDVHK